MRLLRPALTTACLVLFAIGGAIATDQILLPLPDINQVDAGANGRMDCGPAAAANYIFWLRDQGYPNLVSSQDTVPNVLVELETLMRADSTGTGVANFSEGLVSYFRAKGYSVRSMDCAGWRKAASGNPPNLDTIKQTLLKGGGVFLNFGWYRKNASGDYTRKGGHWVTVAGFGRDRQGRFDPSVVTVHDPSPRCGSSPTNEYLRLSGLTSGTLITNKSNVVLPAYGYMQVWDGWKIPTSADAAILDAAVCVVPSPER